MNIADLRKDYKLAALSRADSDLLPSKQFAKWLEEAIAAQLPEPNAMTLATVDQAGRPSTRVVLIKEFDDRGPVWFTNYHSRKGQQLAANPFAALQFHWVELERVVRIEGRVEKISAQESDAYFASRARESQIGAWASPQNLCLTRRDHPIGAATGCYRIDSNFGRAAQAACMTAYSIGLMRASGK